jgi:nicotinamide-nucleotide amidase
MGLGMVSKSEAPAPDRSAIRSLAKAIGEELQRRQQCIAAAESVTGGMLSNFLAEAPKASEWFRGGVVAYSSSVKHELLHVRSGPVVSEGAALDMAHGVAQLLDAAVGLGVTGVGGPDPQDGQPPGTVWIAVHTDGTTTAELVGLEGDPEEICRAACFATLKLAARRLGMPAGA